MRQEYKKDFLQSVLDNYSEVGKIKIFFFILPVMKIPIIM